MARPFSNMTAIVTVRDYRKAAEYIHYGKLSNAAEGTETTAGPEESRREKCPIKIVEVTGTNSQDVATETATNQRDAKPV